jgi:hypothetical protein
MNRKRGSGAMENGSRAQAKKRRVHGLRIAGRFDRHHPLRKQLQIRANQARRMFT